MPLRYGHIFPRCQECKWADHISTARNTDIISFRHTVTLVCVYAARVGPGREGKTPDVVTVVDEIS